MQTSKSYGTTGANVEVKLELDDLEYVFADGQNLIINSEETSDAEDGNVSKILYTDGSQAVMLQGGVKHYIQTVGGETYLLGDDSDTIQQLVINTDDQSEESNGAVEYVQTEDNVETVIYKLANPATENDEDQLQTRRFKVGDTEYVALREGIELVEDNQFSILDENSLSEHGNFQYAILKDGKLHLQLRDSDSIEMLNDSSVSSDETKQDGDFLDVEERMPEYVLVKTSETMEKEITSAKIAGKDLLTGKIIILDDYLEEMQSKVNRTEKVQRKSSNRQKSNQYLNKKLLIRKNANGKCLFGKILHIEPAQPTTEGAEGSVQDSADGEPAVFDVNMDELDTNRLHEDADDDDYEAQDVLCDDSGQVVGFTQSEEHNNEVTEEQMNFLSKTLNGLIDMPSLRKKLMDKRLEIKYVEKKFNKENRSVHRDVRYITGCLLQQDSGFVLDESDEKKNVTSLTVTVVHDNNQKTTKVTFHEKPLICQICNRNFRSLGLLNKHMQTYHSEKNLCCNMCQVKFTDHASLTEHRKYAGHYFICDTCNKRFTTRNSLKRHISIHDQNLKHLECVICKARFATISNLSKHLLTHSDVKAYHCEICGKSFTTVGDLNVHRRIHNPAKTCFCYICGREFSRHSNLLRHTEIHKGEGNLYKCGICDCSYKYVSSLTRHVVQNHLKQPV